MNVYKLRAWLGTGVLCLTLVFMLIHLAGCATTRLEPSDPRCRSAAPTIVPDGCRFSHP